MTPMQIALADNLQAIIDEFRVAFPNWQTQIDAYCECESASEAFIDWVGKQFPGTFATHYGFNCNDAIRNPDPSVYIGVGLNESQQRKSGWHDVVEMQDCYVDWTARQYKVDIPYPYVIPKVRPLASLSGGGRS